ncbi:hypothetical protein L3V83_09130 [Thiotrichales bacterium 19X7-9]|nr:hypothetical protein [Thiotrichales bacterium 19X7-9]
MIKVQVEDALQPIMAELNFYIDKLSKTDVYKDVQVGAAEAARLLNRSVAMIHIYVDEGQLIPVDPHEKCKKFTLEEIDRFRSESTMQRRKDF